MYNFNNSLFVDNSKISIPKDAKIVFVSDMYVENYVGGAELTTQALIDECPLSYVKILSKDVNMALLKQGAEKFWVFGNFAHINPELIPTIIGNLKYTVLEYDYKYCRYRSPEKHLDQTGTPCDCHNQLNGKLISAFYYASTCLWWMSEAQKEKYHTLFPFLSEKSNVILSSVFDKKTLGKMKWLREKCKTSSTPKEGWIVLGSDSWVKGADAAKNWCEQSGKKYDIVWNISYDEMLAKLASAEGFAYLPAGADTCPRMVIEAKLLGCNLHLNNNVQHKNEEWFATEDLESIEGYLYSAPALFWNGIKNVMNYKPSISGYTTVHNCYQQKYPFIQCIDSLKQFCNEICVVDGGSTDGTWEKLQEMATKDPSIKIKQISRDWNHPRFAVFDGMQKAEARKMCTSNFCWQMDCDEIVHEDDAAKILDLCKKMPAGINLISLPVIEYWGGSNKVRADIMPWKWRLSKNLPGITHGIPKEFRKIDDQGNLYAVVGDGCDMIDEVSGDVLPHVTFYTAEIDQLRNNAVNGDPSALEKYEIWFNDIIENIPGVFHYSWYDIERKINLYKNYWTKHWESLSGKEYKDTSESNMFFDVPWSSVTDEMIKDRAKELKEKLGGWIWHKKWDGVTKTYAIKVKRSQPKFMVE